ncbi:MAG: hypothetical protein Q7S27_05800 [Nanoarchaeota archaeon]|nr:hypothetical protein [Nanoarchaeota archaeon]
MDYDGVIQERNLENIASNNGFKFSDTFFPYTSGKIGPEFVNAEVVCHNRDHHDSAIEDLARLIRNKISAEKYDFISGGESRDWVFSFQTAQKLGKAHVMLYKDGKYIGGPLKNKKIIHVADINNEGSSIEKHWKPIIEKEGGKIETVFFYVEKCDEGKQVMKRIGLESYALVYLDENSWKYLLDREYITKENYKSISKRKKDPEKWAREMLLSEKGIERLKELLDGNNKNRDRALKVLERGYPDLKEEILARLKNKNGGKIESLIKMK